MAKVSIITKTRSQRFTDLNDLLSWAKARGFVPTNGQSEAA